MEECFFDATTVDPLDSGFAPIPEGDYEVAIVKSQNKPTKSGTGSYLELQCQVVSGEHAKRVLWTRLNLKNPSTAAVEMAKRELYCVGDTRLLAKNRFGIPSGPMPFTWDALVSAIKSGNGANGGS